MQLGSVTMDGFTGDFPQTAPDFPAGPGWGCDSLLTGPWRYHDGGVDPGIDWRGPGYNDSGWPLGTGLFHYDVGVLPVATNTTLAAGRTTYYFRTTFNFSGATSNRPTP